MNKTNIPPINTKNKIYENQNVSYMNPIINDDKKVWINNINPIDKGWLSW